MLTKQHVAELIELTAKRDEIALRMEPDLLELKHATKRIEAIVGMAEADLVKANKKSQKRFGVLFRLVEKAGTTAWRKVCESIKGKEWCDLKAAEAEPKTECQFQIL